MMISDEAPPTNRALKVFAVPTAIALLAVAAAIGLLLFWSAVRTDQLEFDRQSRLVDSVVSRQAASAAIRIEAHTTWTEAIIQVRKPNLDLEWVDGLLGTYLFSSAGIDETYVLDTRDAPIYSAQEGRRASRAAFDSARSVLSPLVRALRAKMAEPRMHLMDGAITPSVIDYAVIHGHPAIVTVKPITPVGAVVPGRMGVVRSNVPDLRPGEEYIHVSVKRMDENSRLLTALRQDHFYERVRFSWTADTNSGEAAHPIQSPWSGRIVGYYLWTPLKPGSIVLMDMILPLLAALLVIGAVALLLLRRIRRSTIELQASEAQAKHLAFHDVLTGLPNRALFDDRLDRALSRARRQPDQKVALLCLDVDRFKQVNDTLGHPAGDELIREIAQRLCATVRDTDTVARLGGDEFAIIQTGIRSGADITTMCKRILKTVSDAFDIHGHQVFVGMSIGVARAGPDGFERTELCRKADIALYHAKAEGRGRHAVFTNNMDATIQVRRGIEHQLRAALKKGDELCVYYQAKYDAASKEVTGMEALVRWQHPDDGLICPTLFIPIAEECGLIEPLGDWVLKEACSAALHWPNATISVNISAIQLRNPLFAQRTLKIVRGTGLQPSRLELEITETAFIDNAEQCRENLKAVRASGVRIALDDFGTGYSSLRHLHSFDVDRLKIDRSFIMGIQSSGGGTSIVRAIVELARSSGLQVTAEGVETTEQSQFLCSVGCNELQGHFMSRPMPLEQLNKMLGVSPKMSASPIVAEAA